MKIGNNYNLVSFRCKENQIIQKTRSSGFSKKAKVAAAIGTVGAVVVSPFIFMKKNPTVIRCKNQIIKVLDKIFGFWSHIA